MIYLKSSLLLFILSIENSRGSHVEAWGSGHEQMMPKLENKVFSVKSTQCMRLKRHKEFMTPCLILINEVCRDKHGMATVTLAHAPRVNDHVH